MVRNNLVEINLICCISSLKLIIFEIKKKQCVSSEYLPTAKIIGFLKCKFYVVAEIDKSLNYNYFW